MMKKYTFDEQNGLWYEQCGEYQLPCLTVPNSKSPRSARARTPGTLSSIHFSFVAEK